MSKVSIVNRALTLLGEAKIVSLEDNTLGAKSVSDIYAGSLRSILAETCWNFAKKRVVLNMLKEKPAWGGGNYFQLPADMVRMFKATVDDHEIEGDKLKSNHGEVGILYTYYNDNDESYSPAFIDAFVHKLAYDICFDLTNSTTKTEMLLDLYQGHFLPIAKSMNARDNAPDEVKDDLWVNQVRY